MLGTCTGQLKLYNVFTGQEEASYSCHTSAITHLEPSRVNKHLRDKKEKIIGFYLYFIGLIMSVNNSLFLYL